MTVKPQKSADILAKRHTNLMEYQHHIFTVSIESSGGSFSLFSVMRAHIIIVLLATASIHKFD